MIRVICTICIFLLHFASSAQDFEGKIVYKNEYKIKMASPSSEEFTKMMGSIQEYYISKGDYISVMNGTYVSSQSYIHSEHKLYTKLTNLDTFLYNSESENSDKVEKFEIKKGVTEILEYPCDMLILTCSKAVYKYYFCSSLSLDEKLFSNHHFGNFSDYTRLAKSIPLKISMDNEAYSLESIATEVKPMKLEPSFFMLPKSAPVKKNPF